MQNTYHLNNKTNVSPIDIDTKVLNACIKGNLTTLETCVADEHVNLTQIKNTEKESLLRLAIKSNHLDITKFLLNNGMKPDDSNKPGLPLLWLVHPKPNHLVLAELLLKYGADIYWPYPEIQSNSTIINVPLIDVISKYDQAYGSMLKEMSHSTKCLNRKLTI